MSWVAMCLGPGQPEQTTLFETATLVSPVPPTSVPTPNQRLFLFPRADPPGVHQPERGPASNLLQLSGWNATGVGSRDGWSSPSKDQLWLRREISSHAGARHIYILVFEVQPLILPEICRLLRRGSSSATTPGRERIRRLPAGPWNQRQQP